MIARRIGFAVLVLAMLASAVIQTVLFVRYR
jgi:hypothetical protein